MVDGKLRVDVDLIEFMATSETMMERFETMRCFERCLKSRGEQG